MSRGRRLLGLEYERLILHRETGESAPLSFCREFFGELVNDLGATGHPDGDVLSRMTGGDFALSMEPGGQLEVATASRGSPSLLLRERAAPARPILPGAIRKTQRVTGVFPPALFLSSDAGTGTIRKP